MIASYNEEDEGLVNRPVVRRASDREMHSLVEDVEISSPVQIDHAQTVTVDNPTKKYMVWQTVCALAELHKKHSAKDFSPKLINFCFARKPTPSNHQKQLGNFGAERREVVRLFGQKPRFHRFWFKTRHVYGASFCVWKSGFELFA